MMARVSVIIPTYREAERIHNLIKSLIAQGFDEIIVADASDDNMTSQAAINAGAICLSDLPPGRGRQMHAGAQVATGEIFFFLHADSALPEPCYRAVCDCLSKNENLAGCFRLAFDRRHPLLAFYGWCSRLNWRVTTYGDQGLFIRKSTYVDIGGFADMELMEDVELQRRLRARGRFVKLPHEIVTSARRFVKRGIWAQQLLNIIIVIAYSCGVAPARLARWYQCKA